MPKDDGNTFPAYYKQEVAAFMRTYLENPRKVRDASIGTPVQRPIAGAPRYVTCVRYNPQNPENKYEGIKERFVIFHAGKVTQFLDSDPQVCRGWPTSAIRRSSRWCLRLEAWRAPHRLESVRLAVLTGQASAA